MKKFMIKVNGVSYEVEVEEVGGGSAVAQNMPAEKKMPTASANKSVAAAGSNTVIAPMPGTILKLIAEPGKTVKAGEVLLILEAMKMENEIVSPKDGTVGSVNVEKGQSVNVGDVMVVID